ncbi:SDR family NAD(P)-dependent oxidoreductase [Mesotoga sp. H07.pep.5.3]|uniref:SDR family NAD(P)-dependent oxidoreductase n=1 Tax=Mesotoga sp. H07.pep.5.3 TaxID=1421003 RepID=UPI001C558F03|nr:SDR family oxidoreductase [Mesotoga sp. H07.pep.5.3]
MTLQKMLDLKGKTAIVTGGAGHLGKSMAEVLAELGANVIVCGRSKKKCEKLVDRLNEEFKGKSFALELDIGNTESVNQFRTEVIKLFGSIDILVNNAYFGAGRDVLSMTQDEWQIGIEGSVSSVFRMIKAFLRVMIEKNKGSIINIASMYGVVSPDVSIYEDNSFYNPPNYGAGKAAIIQLTKYVACVYGKYGVRCNSVSPGPFPSESVQEDKEFINRLKLKTPLGRIGVPYELKGVIALLASDASSFINGANIVVDGGWTAW